MTNQIMKQKDKYNYSVKMGTGRLMKQKIMLPINELDLPDYDYMEQYVKILCIINTNSILISKKYRTLQLKSLLWNSVSLMGLLLSQFLEVR